MELHEIRQLGSELEAGALDARLPSMGVTELQDAHARIRELLQRFCRCFGEEAVALFSAPGRTELLGNHTDHQHGSVLTASVNLDILGCARPNGLEVIRICSGDYPMIEVAITDLTPRRAEHGTSHALVRGVAAGFARRGCEIGGFDLCAVSDVPGGSGLSSSAAFETLIGAVINGLFCENQMDVIAIAQIGQEAENRFFGKPSGLMDQVGCAHGGAVAIDFGREVPLIREIAFDFAACGHALCITDVGADHADLTHAYAAVPEEMRRVASCLGKEVLRDVDEAQFRKKIGDLREACGDRAVLRAAHFFDEDRRVRAATQVLDQGDFASYLRIMRASGRSSERLLQNIYDPASPAKQAVSIALMESERVLGACGAYRIHGGGFAGTIQAFVPDARVEEYRAAMEAVFSPGCCRVLQVRAVGGCALI